MKVRSGACTNVQEKSGQHLKEDPPPSVGRLIVIILGIVELTLVITSIALESSEAGPTPPSIASAISFAMLLAVPGVLALLRAGRFAPFPDDSPEDRRAWFLTGVLLLSIAANLGAYRVGLVLDLGILALTISATLFACSVTLAAIIAFQIIRRNASGLEILVDFLDIFVYAFAAMGLLEALGGAGLDFSPEALGTRAWIVVGSILLGIYLVTRVYDYRGFPFTNHVLVPVVCTTLGYSVYSALLFRFPSLPYWPDLVLRALASGTVILIPLLGRTRRLQAQIPQHRYRYYRLSLGFLGAVLAALAIELVVEGASGVAGTLQALVIVITGLILGRQYLSYLHGKEIFEKARVSLERYTKLVEEVPDPIVELDADGVVTLVNSAFCERFKIERDQIIGRRLPDLVSRSPFTLDIGPEAKTTRQGEKDVSRSEATHVIKVTLVTPAGKRIFQGTGRQANSHKLQLILRDVTDRVELDRRIAKLSQQLAEIDRSRSELLIKLIWIFEEERRKMAKALVGGPAKDIESAAQALETVVLEQREDSTENTDSDSVASGEGKASLQLENSLVRARTLLGKAVQDLRRAVDDLRPTVLEQKGLEAATRLLAHEILKGSVSQVRIDWRAEPCISPGQENLLYSALRDLFLELKGATGLSAVSIKVSGFGANGLCIDLRFESDSRTPFPGWSPPMQETYEPEGMEGELVAVISPAEKIEAIGGTFEASRSPDGALEVSIKVPGIPHRPASRPTRESA